MCNYNQVQEGTNTVASSLLRTQVTMNAQQETL